MSDDLGKKFSVIGTVEECLSLASKNQRWFTLRFENGSSIVIDVKHCREVINNEKIK